MMSFLYEHEEEASYVFSPPIYDEKDQKHEQKEPYNSLMKCAPTLFCAFLINDKIRDYAQQHNIDPEHKYFAFWEKASVDSISFTTLEKRIKTRFGEHDQYDVRVAQNQGISLYELLEKRTSTFKVDCLHAMRIIIHLLDGLMLLNSHCIYYLDIRMGNIIIQPTAAEQKAHVLFESLPKWIDFDWASVPGDFNQLEICEMQATTWTDERLWSHIRASIKNDDDDKSNEKTIRFFATLDKCADSEMSLMKTKEELLEVIAQSTNGASKFNGCELEN